jgi:hypothetical protein
LKTPALLAETRPGRISEPRPGILYVNLDQVTEDDFKGALDRLAAASGVIFDLRGYPSHISPVVLNHLIDHPFTSARWNVPVVTRPDHQDWGLGDLGLVRAAESAPVEGEDRLHHRRPGHQLRGELHGDRRGLSPGRDRGRPTAGTNGNVNPFTLPGGYRVVWTGMKVTKHDGSRHHGVGIQPTVPVSRTLKGVAEGRDELLEKAIEVVSR